MKYKRDFYFIFQKFYGCTKRRKKQSLKNVMKNDLLSAINKDKKSDGNSAFC